VKIPGKRNNLDDFSELPVIIPSRGNRLLLFKKGEK